MSDISETAASPLTGAENRRTLRWVDPSFQRRYGFLLLSVVLLVGCVLIGSFWFYSDQMLSSLNQAGIQKTHSLYILIADQSRSLLISVTGVVLLFSAFIMMISNVLSHRIVGPIFAIKRSLEMIERENLSEARIQLRSDDEFHEVAESINRVIDKLSK